MADWASVTAVVSGLLATVLLAGAIHLAQCDQEEERAWALTVMVASGLAASVLFGGLLALRLIVELIRAAASLSL